MYETLCHERIYRYSAERSVATTSEGHHFMAATPQRIRIKDEEHVLTRDDIINAAKAESPRRINAYFVEIEGRKFPPKQLLRAATNTTQSFDTGVAVRALTALGFKVVSLAEAPKQ